MEKKEFCEKTAYPNQDAARTAATGINIEKKKGLFPYPCTHCGEWHLATRGKPKKRNNMKRACKKARQRMKYSLKRINKKIKK